MEGKEKRWRWVCPECGGEDILVRVEAWLPASIINGTRTLDSAGSGERSDDWVDDDKAHCEHCGWTGKARQAERMTAPEGCLDVFGDKELKKRRKGKK